MDLLIPAAGHPLAVHEPPEEGKAKISPYLSTDLTHTKVFPGLALSFSCPGNFWQPIMAPEKP